MIGNDDLAYKTRHIVGAHIWLLLLRSAEFLFPFTVTRYTFGKLYDWPIQIHVNEQVGYMQRMNNRCYKHVLSGLSELFIY